MNTLQIAAFFFALIGGSGITLLYKINAIAALVEQEVKTGAGTLIIAKQVMELHQLRFPLFILIAWSAVGLTICLAALFA